MKISILMPDASEEIFARANTLYKLLKDNFELEVIAVSSKRAKVFNYKDYFENYKKIDFDLGTIVNDLKKNISGDILYALKAKPTSFGFAMSLKSIKKIPVILDIDSREIYNTFPYSDNIAKNILFSIPLFNDTNSFIYTWILEKRIKHADQITVASPALQKIYGGTFIPSACDTDFFNPELYKREEIRKAMGWEDYKIILFAGNITRNTDIEFLVKAVKETNSHKIKIVIIGNNQKKFKEDNIIEAKGSQPIENVAKLLTACDLVVIPQKNIPSSIGEIPVKLYEAMASEKVVIAPDTHDFSDILENCGFVYKIGDINSLKEQITKVLSSEELSISLGKKAREKCIDKYSKKVIEKKLKEFFSKFESKINADGRT